MSSTSGLPEGTVADAVKGNWVDRRAPVWSRPYLRLSRADRPIGTWLLLLPCWWSLALAAIHKGTFGLYELWIGIGCALGAFVMRGAGCTWNDITDRHIDAKVARTKSRPLPAGQITLSRAIYWMIGQALIGLVILLTFQTAAILLGILSLVPVTIYPFAKRFTWWPQVFLGIAFNWGALLVWAAVTGSLGWPAVLLYLGGISWTLFYDTIYAYQDIEDDALIGVKSTARLFGDNSRVWLQRFLVSAIALIGAAAVLATLNAGIFPLIISLLGVSSLACHLFWQISRFDVENNEVLIHLFRSNRNAGLVVLLFFACAFFL